MCSFGKGNGDLTMFDLNRTGAFHKVPIEFGRITGFESSQILSQPGVKRIGNHRHDHIEVDLGQYWR